MMAKAESGGRRGWLFVFEGIDGSGKTTQVRRAAEALRARGLRVVELVEPTDGPYGRQIRSSSRQGGRRPSPEEETELFIRDRMEDVENNIAPALERGDVILLDRYYFSTMAYQGARCLDPGEIRRRNEAFAPRPDLVLFFDVNLDEAMRRIERQRASATDLFERRDYLAHVKSIYDDTARQDDCFHTLDAGADEDAVARQVLAAIDRCMTDPQNRGQRSERKTLAEDI
jgi:dTMP kinase